MQSLIYIYIWYPSHINIYIHIHTCIHTKIVCMCVCIYIYVEIWYKHSFTCISTNERYVLAVVIHMCIYIYTHKLCWPWLFFGHNTSHFLTFPIDSATSRLETRKTTLAWLPQSPMPATWNALSHVTTHHLFSLSP